MGWLLPNMSFHIPARWWAIIGCVLALAVGAAHLTDDLRARWYEAELARAFSPELSGQTVEASWSFPFQSTRAMVRMQVDAAELAAAERLDTDRIFEAGGALRRRYVQAVVAAQAESAFMDRLVGEMRRIRDERDLDSDEYLELLVTAVQSIPYGDTEVDTLLGPQVCARGAGICTDKSLLLASLLLRESYDSVLWVFSTQKHVAVGVRSTSADFRDTGYAFVETTALRFIGQASQEYLAPGPVAESPVQISLGGTKAYTAGNEVEVILAELKRLEGIAITHKPYVSFARTAVRHRDRYAERALESWIADGALQFIMTNTHDRAGVYSILAPTAAAPQASEQ